jgi:CBS domain-containing protein
MRPAVLPKREGKEDTTSAVLNRSPMAMDIMQCSVLTVGPDDSVYKAVCILAEKRVSGLPVVDNTELVGIISEKDVLRLMYETKFLPGSVKDYMTKTVKSFDIQASVDDIGNCLVQNSFRRVAITRDGALAGIVSRSDLIRYGAHRLIPDAEAKPKGSHPKAPLAQDVMQCGLLTVRRQTPLHEAASLLASYHITGLPVVDEALHLLGIITEKDILRAIFASENRNQTVTDLMTENVTWFSQTDSMFDICDCLIHNDFRRVPILKQRRLVGLISRADIMVYILENKATIFGTLL